MSEPIHLISLGAGVQSSTMALMAAHGLIKPHPVAASIPICPRRMEGGVQVTFSKTPPTAPGAYWHRRNSKVVNPDDWFLVTISKDGDGRMIDSNGDYVEELGGEWSARLVPVDEVKKAYREGFTAGRYHGEDWTQSRARRVVEGIEQ